MYQGQYQDVIDLGSILAGLVVAAVNAGGQQSVGIRVIDYPAPHYVWCGTGFRTPIQSRCLQRRVGLRAHHVR